MGSKKAPAKPKEKSAVILTVFDISDMTTAGRRAIIKWIRSQADNIEQYHKDPGFSKRYTARYIYADKK